MIPAPIIPPWVGLALAHATPETCERFAACGLSMAHLQSAHWTHIRFRWLSGLHIALGPVPTPASMVISGGSMWSAMHDQAVLLMLLDLVARHLGSAVAAAVAERLVATIEVESLAASTHDRIVAMGSRR
jgi:transcriptional regulator GlxA family with amidase domain